MKTKIRIKKALIEAKFMAKPEDMDKLMPKLDKDDIVKLVDESDITEAPAVNNPKIEKYVNDLNNLIASAIDSDGDPIMVLDKSGTWEEPEMYYPIVYKNGSLKITSKSISRNEPEINIINKSNMEMDGIPTLKMIRRLYNLALKQNSAKSNKPQIQDENEDERAGRSVQYGYTDPELSDDEINKPIDENDINLDKLKTDVAKLMEKLNLGQFDNIFKKIDKPQEQAEVIAAFAERIGVPRSKLSGVISSIKQTVENAKASITKEKLEEFIKNKNNE